MINISEWKHKDYNLHEWFAYRVSVAKPKEKLRIRAMFNDKYKKYVI